MKCSRIGKNQKQSTLHHRPSVLTIYSLKRHILIYENQYRLPQVSPSWEYRYSLILRRGPITTTILAYVFANYEAVKLLSARMYTIPRGNETFLLRY